MTSCATILMMRISLLSGIARKPSRGSRNRPCSDILNAYDRGFALFRKRHAQGMARASHIRQKGQPGTSPAELTEALEPASGTPQPHNPAARHPRLEQIVAAL